ncbi:MAG: pyruvate carboxylase subunit B [Candidatus Methanofastidiosum methylothiophilum]|jgi:biotin carboxyl carrier protein|uniref:Pyruvate carboxylase subunit B n=1 Tax=Candidatus Methanofastidiosum methylothiophilum TaxID=1705564 RepID=A0A150JH42_9EURY|nr:MAG: pyruvate carboxylase subunit B [Candidatus Methanofastidiosum methylthiophilus]MBP6932658.1 acetyl-CoA carboxylase biotin carboxyl carrier protein subunit [Methanofastidiosum sp.]OQC51640.1 MAG: pyruvate carboxylase subunit B [Euryarchaeota archaeon ADurb.Bin023]KYC56542.1 MAG: pyruvate carboxylase subunit B [Candidatus Methanofastidiosum methylthiophilus]KYC58072.1 MAG: pyruvate carboxylase subunit B [Candidatus Methanofastidiosum methylthiophilus]
MDEFKIKINDKEHQVKLKKISDGEYQVFYDEFIYEVSILKKAQIRKNDDVHYRKENDIIYVESVVGGIVLKLEKKVNERVTKGDPIMTLIAMKMETIIHAPESGLLLEIAVNEGMIVEKGELLFTIGTK